MGKKYSDINEEKRNLSYVVEKGSNDTVRVKIDLENILSGIISNDTSKNEVNC